MNKQYCRSNECCFWITFWFLFVLIIRIVNAQEIQNHDESKVPPYVLPELLTCSDGKTINTTNEWEKYRRPEILEIFENEVYGEIPQGKYSIEVVTVDESKTALNSLAHRKQVQINIINEKGIININVLLYMPASLIGPFPVFLGYNFTGNHAINADPEIVLSDKWILIKRKFGTTSHVASPQTRGNLSSQWPIEKIISRGYGLVTAYYGDIDPDFDDGFQNGVHPMFYNDSQVYPDSNQWGSISAWAWGISRIIDYLYNVADIDKEKICVIGHSRLGKTALWAAAKDQRIAMVISNNSGCGGAALSRRIFGETVAQINTSYPNWFCDNFTKYNNKEQNLPVDQHMLLALVAPRLLYVASASDDFDADPRGEFLSAKEAEKVYTLYGKKGIATEVMPGVNEPYISGSIGYHIRQGVHDITDYDWQQYLDFADLHLGRD